VEKKIVRIGNSLGVVIPSIYLEELKVAQGDFVEVDFNADLKTISIKNKNTAPSADHLDRLVRNAVDNYLKELNIGK
jgi:antitoxin component of MazEF toxin-antitoxin module